MRFRSGRTWLAGTLAVPAGATVGRASSLVHGSGATTRNDPAVLAACFEAQGFAVLPTTSAASASPAGVPGRGRDRTPRSRVYARDAAAAARLPGCAARGRPAPASASRARARPAGSRPRRPRASRRSASSRSSPGPTVTAGEVSAYAALTTAGRRRSRPTRRPRSSTGCGRPARAARPRARASSARDPVAVALRRARPARADGALRRAARRHRRRRPRLPACRPLPDRERARPDAEDLRSDRYADRRLPRPRLVARRSRLALDLASEHGRRRPTRPARATSSRAGRSSRSTATRSARSSGWRVPTATSPASAGARATSTCSSTRSSSSASSSPSSARS